MGTGSDDHLYAWAAAHHGLYRTDDALRLGLSRRQIAYRVQQGRAERVGTSVYRVVGSAPTRDQRVLAAAWRARGVASFRTAAEMSGLIDSRGGRPHVLVVRTNGHVHDDAIVHRTQDLLAGEVTSIRRIPVTTPARTLVDIGLTITDLDLEHMLHQAIHRRLTTLEEVADTYRRISRRGRNGAGPIRDLLDAYGSGSPAESKLEVLILRILREHGVPPPVRQHPVTADGHDFRLDLAHPTHRVFLEGDGFGVHGGRTPFEDDRWRQDLLVLQGWWPIRFTWRQARERPEWCAGVVGRKLAGVENDRK